MSSKIKTLFIALLVIILIGVGVTAYYYYISPPPAREQTDNNQVTNQNGFSKLPVPPERNPEKFPADIPIEAGAVITQNYNASTEDGRFQATKEFQTSRTLAENLITYRNYMNDNGWEIRSTVDQQNYKMLFGVKGGADLQISMDYNSELDSRKITIFYTELPVK